MSKPPSNTPYLELKQTQSQTLTMTPQLQQAIELLQMNAVEVEAFVDAELESNPLLEKADPVDPEDGAEGLPSDMPEISDPPSEDEGDAAFDRGDVSGEGLKYEHVRDGGAVAFGDGLSDFVETQVGEVPSLRDHVTAQLHQLTADPMERAMGAVLLDHLSEAGYFTAECSVLADQLGVEAGQLEAMLRRMKGFDPSGIFAADLPECLAIQLHDKGALDGVMQSLLDHLPLLAARDYARLEKVCGVNAAYLRDMIAEVQALNPKPASIFQHTVVQTRIPDAIMERRPRHLGGGWRVRLNQSRLPKVLVNQEYYTVVASRAARKDDKAYLSERMQAANWLVRALDQRAQTILKVSAALVEAQEAFFNYGIAYLRPLTLKDIAAEVQMHESTISRVTTDKYLTTPRGVYELKFFFSTGLLGAGGAVHSAEAIKARIKELIDAEPPAAILSDDKIVILLKAEDITVARRTVAKYREAMKIGSSVERRRSKKQIGV